MNLPYKIVMVPLDGSDLSEKALSHAQLLATQFDSELLLFQAVPEVEMLFQITDIGIPAVSSSAGLQQRLLDQAAEYLDTHSAALGRHGLKVQIRVDIGEPAAKIIQNAKELDVDLLVMNTHGRTGLARWALGSVAAKVLEAAPCPVLLVREKI